MDSLSHCATQQSSRDSSASIVIVQFYGDKMERPAKRQRILNAQDDASDQSDDELLDQPEVVSMRRDPGYQLERKRANAVFRLKSTFESIFEKYGKDFSGVGDEIDLATGEIVVNNGHLEMMENEQDTGEDYGEEGLLESGSQAGSETEDEEAAVLHGRGSRGRLTSAKSGPLRLHTPSLFGRPGQGLFGNSFGYGPPRLSTFASSFGSLFNRPAPFFGGFGFGNGAVDPVWQAPELPLQPAFGGGYRDPFAPAPPPALPRPRQTTTTRRSLLLSFNPSQVDEDDDLQDAPVLATQTPNAEPSRELADNVPNRTDEDDVLLGQANEPAAEHLAESVADGTLRAEREEKTNPASDQTKSSQRPSHSQNGQKQQKNVPEAHEGVVVNGKDSKLHSEGFIQDTQADDHSISKTRTKSTDAVSSGPGKRQPLKSHSERLVQETQTAAQSPALNETSAKSTDAVSAGPRKRQLLSKTHSERLQDTQTADRAPDSNQIGAEPTDSVSTGPRKRPQPLKSRVSDPATPDPGKAKSQAEVMTANLLERNRSRPPKAGVVEVESPVLGQDEHLFAKEMMSSSQRNDRPQTPNSDIVIADSQCGSPTLSCHGASSSLPYLGDAAVYSSDDDAPLIPLIRKRRITRSRRPSTPSSPRERIVADSEDEGCLSPVLGLDLDRSPRRLPVRRMLFVVPESTTDAGKKPPRKISGEMKSVSQRKTRTTATADKSGAKRPSQTHTPPHSGVASSSPIRHEPEMCTPGNHSQSGLLATPESKNANSAFKTPGPMDGDVVPFHNATRSILVLITPVAASKLNEYQIIDTELSALEQQAASKLNEYQITDSEPSALEQQAASSDKENESSRQVHDTPSPKERSKRRSTKRKREAELDYKAAEERSVAAGSLPTPEQQKPEQDVDVARVRPKKQKKLQKPNETPAALAAESTQEERPEKSAEETTPRGPEEPRRTKQTSAHSRSKTHERRLDRTPTGNSDPIASAIVTPPAAPADYHQTTWEDLGSDEDELMVVDSGDHHRTTVAVGASRGASKASLPVPQQQRRSSLPVTPRVANSRPATKMLRVPTGGLPSLERMPAKSSLSTGSRSAGSSGSRRLQRLSLLGERRRATAAAAAANGSPTAVTPRKTASTKWVDAMLRSDGEDGGDRGGEEEEQVGRKGRAGTPIRSPGGTIRRCGVDGFVCDRDFCFNCL